MNKDNETTKSEVAMLERPNADVGRGGIQPQGEPDGAEDTRRVPRSAGLPQVCAAGLETSDRPGGHDRAHRAPSTTAARPVKWRRMLAILASGQRLNRFENAHLGDSCLNTTVHKITQEGVPVQRRTIRVPGFQGCPTHICEYWLDARGFAAAQKILQGPEVARA